MSKNYSVSIQFVASDPSHRSMMTNGSEALKYAKKLAEERKGSTIELHATWFKPGSYIQQNETRRFRWDDKTGKVKERT